MLTAALVLALAPPAAVSYALVESESSVVARLNATGIGSAFAHDHVVRAGAFSGQIEVDPQRRRLNHVEVTVDATALVADEPAMREAWGLTQPMSDRQRSEIQATMVSAEQLAVEQHPTIRFTSTSVTPTGDGRTRIRGTLELHGEKGTVEGLFRVTFHGDDLRVRGSFSLLQSDFGIEPYEALLGAIRNEDTVVIHIDAVARREPAR